jgi:hypothetical protein
MKSAGRRWDLAPKISDRAIGFTVTMLPLGTSPHTAKPDDFKRVSVRAINSLAARSAPDVLTLQGKGYYPAEICEEGRESLEIGAARARTRATGGDEVPADLRSANNAAPAVGPYIPSPRAG